MAFANFEAIERFTGKRLLSKNIVLLTMRSLALLLFILAIAGTIISYQGLASDQDFVLAIDSSGSMLATDFTPNRLDVAKTAAQNFIDVLPRTNKIGLVTFSGVSLIKSNPTEDKSLIKTKIIEIEPNTIGGTAIGEAIITSVNLLHLEEKSKTIVLLTDGQNNVGASIDEAIEYANQNNIVIHTIGIGTEEGGTFPNLSEDVVIKLDETSLKEIASKTNGEYFRATNEQELNQAYEKISSIKETTIAINLSLYFIFAGLLIIISEWVLTNTKYRTLP